MLGSRDIHQAQKALWFGLFPADFRTHSMLSTVGTLSCLVDNPHITFGYKVEPHQDILWNQIYFIEITGYGNDGVNEGYCVEIPDCIGQHYFGAETPHITLSVSEDGSPVNTAFIEFDPLEESIVIPMKFGYFYRGSYYV